MSSQKEAWLSARAYALWEMSGRPAGRDQEHWLKAVAEYEQLQRTKASADGEEILKRRRGAVPVIPMADASERSILVVDDDARLRFNTVDLLEQAGYPAHEAANADEALIRLRTSSFDTVITDINMPGSVDGLGLAARVRSLWPKTRIIVASGLVRLREQDLPRGMTFVLKPVADAKLLALLAGPEKTPAARL